MIGKTIGGKAIAKFNFGRGFCLKGLALTQALLALLLLGRAAYCQGDQPKSIKISFVTFLSGPAAGPFGVPARNGAELVVKALNEGTMPAPYNGSKGIGGRQIEWKFFDEAGGPQQQVAQYRQLVEREHSDVIIGYISSGDCKALAPVAEELKTLTIYFDCGTPVIFEDVDLNPHYVFRTGPHIAMDEVAVGRYTLAVAPNLKTIAAINQNYDYGQEAWKLFSAVMETLKPEVKFPVVQFPKLFAGQYGADISAMLTAQPDVVFSSFWGGDLEAFILQGNARGLFKNRLLVLSAGEPAMYRLATQIPDGTIMCARGPHGVFAPSNELNRWFRKAYHDTYGIWPVYASYKIAMAILGVKTAYEKAASAAGRTPTTDEIINALAFSKWETPSGEVELALANGHQAIQANAVGRFKYDPQKKEPEIVDIKYYPARCVNPPPGVKSIDWIKSGFKGAQCD